MSSTSTGTNKSGRNRFPKRNKNAESATIGETTAYPNYRKVNKAVAIAPKPTQLS